ncbi:hypothetical protein GO988_13250 [Hymenobacter sp. HMF4947]|uniref:Glycosyltransferase family 8 protein n=1 Tax=Hymenobacter ginkgonis TaxID=2682976 RepID=A0A7K1TFX1_9BACT|nr:glycosyltransferase family 8 protein [Hymenobacter ginkgonis]MVN77296.1 hypothetical protein [Hymenobacter ginkgonis]
MHHTDSTTKHLAAAFDHNYLTPFYVLLTSIFANNSGVNFHIHAIASGVSTQDREEIQRFVKQHGAAISFYVLNPEAVAGLVLPKHLYFTEAAYYRLFFPALVPDSVEKLLYLDTDIVVVGSLAALYDTPLHGYPVGAVAEVRATKNRPDLGIYEIGTYFNSGVMLLNIPEWRRQRITEKALQFIRDFPEKIIWVDQDALNVVLANNYVKLDERHNVIPFDIPRYLLRAQHQQFLQDKTLIHYTLKQHKPWLITCQNKFRYLYHQYLAQSPRSHEKGYKNTQLTLHTVKTLIWVRTFEFLLTIPKMDSILTLLLGKGKGV